jgi:hypothetical protein
MGRVSATTGQRLVYRPTVSRVSVVGFVLFALWWAVDDLVTGDGGNLPVTGPVLLAIGIALWGVFWRPAVIVDDTGVDLLNVVRDVHVPWRVLELVETRYALTLHVGERRYRSWAAGAPGRPVPVPARAASGSSPDKAGAREHVATGDAEAVRASRSLRGDSGAAAFMVEQRWEAQRSRKPAPAGPAPAAADGAAAAAADRQVRVRWVWHWPVAVVVALVAAVVAASVT